MSTSDLGYRPVVWFGHGRDIVPLVTSLGYRHFQKRDWYSATCKTVFSPNLVGDVSAIRSGISPMRTRVTASADFEMETRLYPP